MPSQNITCSIDGCAKPAITRGWCKMHYNRWIRRGDPLVIVSHGRPVSDRVCSVPGCGRKHCAQGLCNGHWQRKRHGWPVDVPIKPWRTRTLEERLSQYIDKNGPVPERRPELGSCWLWTGSRNRGGYGFTNVGLRHKLAHRVVYTLLRGDIPDGLVLDHLCVNPPCVNPWHLEPVTLAENTRRGRQH